MFTGLIEDVGRVERVISGQTTDLWIASKLAAEGMTNGQSIAVDGACLTVVEMSRNQFRVQASPETLRRTTLGSLETGAPVNLERPLHVGDRLGGHWVLGHVDTVSRILETKAEGGALAMRFSLPSQIAGLFIEKGSVAIDGISLTVNEVADESFGVMLIPETRQRTHLGDKQIGRLVNLEADLIGKYVARLYALRQFPGAAEAVDLDPG